MGFFVCFVFFNYYVKGLLGYKHHTVYELTSSCPKY